MTQGPVSKPLDTTCLVHSAEHNAFTFYLASVYERMVACVLDHVFLLLGMVVLFMIGGFLMAGLGVDVGGFLATLLFLLAFVVAWTYFVLLEGLWGGQTLGKKIMSIRVVSAKGTPIQMSQAFIRNMLRVVDMLPHLGGLSGAVAFLPFYVVGFASCFATGKRQRLGDLAAGTIVVQSMKTRSTGMPEVDAEDLRFLLDRLPSHLVLSREEARAIMAYIQRRDRFSAGRREELAAPFADRLKRQFGIKGLSSNDQLIRLCYFKYFGRDR